MAPLSAWRRRRDARCCLWFWDAWLWLERLACRHEWCAWLNGNEMCAHCLKLRRGKRDA